jgi:hypothetical protein
LSPRSVHQCHEGSERTIEDRDLRSVQGDEEVVDLQGVQGGEQVLYRVGAVSTIPEGGSPLGGRHLVETGADRVPAP